MLVSYKWLQEYFDAPLPPAEDLASMISLKAFEIEEVTAHGDDWIIDVDVLPNRAHDCLSHDGIAREIAMMTGLKLKKREIPLHAGTFAPSFTLSVETDLCRRYVAREITNVRVAESAPELKAKIEALGQRSINNIVDITNIVMFAVGQPMHAFDADKITGNIVVRRATDEQEITTLDNKQVKLNMDAVVIYDNDTPLAIAGIKGGKIPEVDGATKRIILESANFNPTYVRKTSRKIGVMTDSSKRFENEVTPAIADLAMDMATELILKYAATDVTAVSLKAEHYPKTWRPYRTGVSVREVNALLGTAYSEKEIAGAFDRLGFEYVIVNPREVVISEGQKLVGVPYKWASSVFFDAPNAFDCSSFTAYVSALAGLSVPRMSVDQFVYAEKISQADMQPGDVIFANTGDLKHKIDYKSVEFAKGTDVVHGVDHVGFYTGDGKVLHATELNDAGVVEEKIADSARFQNIVGYGRFFAPNENRFALTVPVERLDIKTGADVIEEVGRVLGYEHVKETAISQMDFAPAQNKMYAVSQKIKATLNGLGFSEVYTYTFVPTGVIAPENPISEDKAFLRTTLAHGIGTTLPQNLYNIDFLMLDQVRVFEIGKVFPKKGIERVMLGICVANRNGFKKPRPEETIKDTLSKLSEVLGVKLVTTEISDTPLFVEIDLEKVVASIGDISYEPLVPVETVTYAPISAYPFMIRDVAVWVPDAVAESDVLALITKNAGPLMIKNRLFDVFKKDGRTSYAFRLVFQSFEKTLTDAEVNAIMDGIAGEMKKSGWEVR